MNPNWNTGHGSGRGAGGGKKAAWAQGKRERCDLEEKSSRWFEALRGELTKELNFLPQLMIVGQKKSHLQKSTETGPLVNFSAFFVFVFVLRTWEACCVPVCESWASLVERGNVKACTR